MLSMQRRGIHTLYTYAYVTMARRYDGAPSDRFGPIRDPLNSLLKPSLSPSDSEIARVMTDVSVRDATSI